VLLHEPQVLLLDEPASGLDPRARIEIRQLLKRLGELNKTVMVSSHILPELADVCNKVGMIEKGILCANGRVDEVMKMVRQAIILHVRVAGDVERAARLLEPHDDVAKVEIRPPDLLVVTLKKGVHDYSFLPTLLVENGLRLLLFREEELNLETAFMELTRGPGAITVGQVSNLPVGLEFKAADRFENDARAGWETRSTTTTATGLHDTTHRLMSSAIARSSARGCGSCGCSHLSHSSDGGPYGRNFSAVPRSSE